MHYFLYVLKCKDGSLYTGITTDLKRRFEEHRLGKGGHYTTGHKPIEVVYTERLPDKSAALKREMQIKGWTRKKKIEVLKIKI